MTIRPMRRASERVRGGLEPHALSRALAPQASVYLFRHPDLRLHRGARTNYSNLRRNAEGLHRPGQAPTRIGKDEPVSADYRPEAEVVELRQRAIRIDTSNFGPDPGPGERVAAERVAELLDEVDIASELLEPERRTSVVAHWAPEVVDGLYRRCWCTATSTWCRPMPTIGRCRRPERWSTAVSGGRGGGYEGLRRDGAQRRTRPGACWCRPAAAPVDLHR